MRHIFKKVLGVAAAAIVLVSCHPNVKEAGVSSGSADFSVYVAVGNSLTAGYGDGALYRSGQEMSFPNILAGQMRLAGGGAFNQPLLPEGSGFGPSGNGRFTLVATGLPGNAAFTVASNNAPSITPLSSDWVFAGDKSSLNNFGVPGMRIVEALVPGLGNPANGAGNFNPYFTRFAQNPATSSVIGDVFARRPTFFTFALGNNDILGFASSGGASGAVTPAATFNAVLNLAVDSLLKATPNTRGVIVGIPDVTRIPLFSTLNPTALAASLPAAVTTIFYRNSAGTVASYPLRSGTTNPLFLADGTLFLLPAQGLFAQGIGFTPTNPLPNNLVLDPGEVRNILNARSAYNGWITAYINRKNREAGRTVLAYFNPDPFFDAMQAGIALPGDTRRVSAAFITGGAFALDGVHLTPRGYAMVTNELISVINASFGATLPAVDARKYPATLFPN